MSMCSDARDRDILAYWCVQLRDHSSDIHTGPRERVAAAAVQRCAPIHIDLPEAATVSLANVTPLLWCVPLIP